MSGDLESCFATWELALRKVNITGYWVTPDIAAMSPQQKRDRAAEVRVENKTRISERVMRIRVVPCFLDEVGGDWAILTILILLYILKKVCATNLRS
jgi:hypothetical protein